MKESEIEHMISGERLNDDEIRNQLNGIVMKVKMFALTEEDVKIDYQNKLGEGNFCSVYPVHVRNEKKQFNEESPPFALKQLNYDIVTHPNPKVIKAVCDDLAKEARIMKELQHDHILPILGMSKQGNIAKDGLFIILEKLESTLDSKLDEWTKDLGPFRHVISKEIVMIRFNKVALAIGQGLQYIHSQNYLFRDLKPANIGFSYTGSIKIFDFGMAVRIPTSSGKDTVKGKFGTLRYMAPETRRGEAYSYPVDVYAYAILLWQIITTRVPFEEDIPIWQPASNYVAPTDNLSDEKRPNLKYVESKELSELLELSWKTNPDERLTLDELVPKLQGIGRKMCLSYEEDEKKKKESFGSKAFNFMVTQYEKNTILTAVCFSAWVQTVLFFLQNEPRGEIVT